MILKAHVVILEAAVDCLLAVGLIEDLAGRADEVLSGGGDVGQSVMLGSGDTLTLELVLLGRVEVGGVRRGHGVRGEEIGLLTLLDRWAKDCTLLDIGLRYVG